MHLPSVRELKNIKGKRVLTRVDFDVPIDGGTMAKNGADRIKAALPTIRFLAKGGARVILAAHLGRPKGKSVSKFSLKKLIKPLSRELGEDVRWSDDIAGESARRLAQKLEAGRILLLENLRFEPGEEKNASAFARALAKLADIYVNEAFAVSHRNHASIVGVPKYISAYAGLRFAEEVHRLSGILKKPKRPFVAILGGAKIETKLPLIKGFLRSADYVLVGGALAAELAKRGELSDNKKLIMPLDTVNERGKPMDIGLKTAKMFSRLILAAKTIVWNGPLGVFENPKYGRGTIAIARAAAKSAKTGAYVVVGGGDTVACVGKFLPKKYVWVSTGGGAMLQYLSEGTLPGIEALCRKTKNH